MQNKSSNIGIKENLAPQNEMQNLTKYKTTSRSMKIATRNIDKNLVSCQYWLPFKPPQAVFKDSKSRKALFCPVLNNLQTEKVQWTTLNRSSILYTLYN